MSLLDMLAYLATSHLIKILKTVPELPAGLHDMQRIQSARDARRQAATI